MLRDVDEVVWKSIEPQTSSLCEVHSLANECENLEVQPAFCVCLMLCHSSPANKFESAPVGWYAGVTME
ncbi:hypothetical protein E4U14_007354 [Claviceps sp. LM454 group G7]|nr:hypothetical protein E4U14_007354 [Claviceps sp. LM454 group G7]